MRCSIVYIIIVATILFASCSRRPGYVLSEKEMADVLYDIQLAQSIFRISSDFSSDEKKDAVVEGILIKHDITQAELDSSLIWYADNLNDYVKINNVVSERLKADYDKLEAEKEALKKSMRDWSAYVLPPFYYLTESTPLLSFKIDSVRMKTIDLDKFIVAFDVLGLNDNNNVETGIYFTYKDTLVKDFLSVKEDTHFILRKPQLPDSLLKNISGYIYLKKDKESINSNVLLYNISYSDTLSVNIDKSDSLSTEITQKDSTDLISAKSEPEKKSDTITKSKKNLSTDEIPVLSREDLNRNPMTRRLRKDLDTTTEKK